jgi:hypothetical protein
MPSISALSEAHLSTLEELTHRNPFEIIDSPWGRIECWRASTLATGTMGALAQVYQMVRNDQAELQEKTVAFDAKKASVLRTVNKLLNFMSRVDALTSRVEALEAKRKADEEQQREFEEPIEEPPGTSDDTPAPSGELHALPPSEEPASEDPELSLEFEDEVGDLPNELEEPPDPVPEPSGTVYPQPTAISLNEG